MKINNAVFSAVGNVFSKRNCVYASVLTAAFTAGSIFGFNEYESRLENQDMETLHPSENILYHAQEDGSPDWDAMSRDTIKLITFDFDQ